MYDLLNEVEINDFEWIIVWVDIVSDLFIVIMYVDNDLFDMLISVEVVFECKLDVLCMLGNVMFYVEGVM